MPADGDLKERCHDILRTIDAARAALEDHLRSFCASSHVQDFALAHQEVVRAGQLVRRALVCEQSGLSAAHGVDDLTRLHGIDSADAARLAALGITRFAQVAAWKPEDVRAIGLALDLDPRFLSEGVIEQASEMIAAAANVPVDAARQSCDQLPGQATEQGGPSLSAIERDELRGVLGRGPKKAQLRMLCEIAPALARAAPIEVRNCDLSASVQWSATPLMRTSPFSAPWRMLSEAETAGSSSDAAGLHVDGSDGVSSDGSAVDTRGADPLKRQPLHVAALDRIARLDEEISALGSYNAGTARVSDDAASATAPSSIFDNLQAPPALQPASAVVPVEEADVTIATRSEPVSRLLEPMTELPLRPRHRLAIPEAPPDAPSEVCEAAVVIVKRRATERAAPNLEFYRRHEAMEPSTTTGARSGRTAERTEGELAS